MKVGVLSDTHIPGKATTLPRRAVDILASSDAIIHAGDYVDDSVIIELEALAPFHGVCGNMDPSEIKRRLPEKRVVELAGFSIGIMHGWGSPGTYSRRGNLTDLLGRFRTAAPKTISGDGVPVILTG